MEEDVIDNTGKRVNQQANGRYPTARGKSLYTDVGETSGRVYKDGENDVLEERRFLINNLKSF